MGVSLTDGTLKRLEMLFSPADRELVSALLIEDCGAGLPFLEKADPIGLERVRFAVLKLSGGNFDAFQRALDLAKVDWRDVLVAAGFGSDLQAHKAWWPNTP